MSTITGLSHAVIYVLDQDEAIDFYTNTLGLEVRTDAKLEGMRWVTLGSPKQPDLEITLMEPMVTPFTDEESVTQLRDLIKKGAMGTGVWRTDDCHATHAALVERGVEFIAPPSERPYGIEALFRDNSGNWFSLTQTFGR